MSNAIDLPLIDHRIYTIAPRKIGEFLELFKAVMPELVEALGNPIGFYTSVVGQQNQFIHLWAFACMADYEAGWEKAESLPGAAPFKEASGPLLISQESRLMRRADLLTPFL